MTQRPEDLGSLHRHVRQLEYAVATTSCQQTLAVLQKMLRDANARLRSKTAI